MFGWTVPLNDKDLATIGHGKTCFSKPLKYMLYRIIKSKIQQKCSTVDQVTVRSTGSKLSHTGRPFLLISPEHTALVDYFHNYKIRCDTCTPYTNKTILYLEDSLQHLNALCDIKQKIKSCSGLKTTISKINKNTWQTHCSVQIT